MRPVTQADMSCFDLVAKAFGEAFREAWDSAAGRRGSLEALSLEALRKETRCLMGVSLWQTRDGREAGDAR